MVSACHVVSMLCNERVGRVECKPCLQPPFDYYLDNMAKSVELNHLMKSYFELCDMGIFFPTGSRTKYELFR